MKYNLKYFQSCNKCLYCNKVSAKCECREEDKVGERFESVLSLCEGQGAGGRDVRLVPGLQSQVQRGVRGPSRVGTEHRHNGTDLLLMSPATTAPTVGDH